MLVLKQNNKELLCSGPILAGVTGGTVGLLVSGINGLLAISAPEGNIMLHWMDWNIFFMTLISGFSVGFILGVIFRFTYNHLPGRRGTVKGIALAVVLSLPYMALRFLSIHSLSVPSLILMEAMAKTAILILVWGALVGYLWNKLP